MMRGKERRAEPFNLIIPLLSDLKISFFVCGRKLVGSRRRMATLEEKIVALDKEIAGYGVRLQNAEESRNETLTAEYLKAITESRKTLNKLIDQQLFAQQQQLQQQQQTSKSLRFLFQFTLLFFSLLYFPGLSINATANTTR
jgi:hypothetical protein